jgi:hypothetical protein
MFFHACDAFWRIGINNIFLGLCHVVAIGNWPMVDKWCTSYYENFVYRFLQVDCWMERMTKEVWFGCMMPKPLVLLQFYNWRSQNAFHLAFTSLLALQCVFVHNDYRWLHCFVSDVHDNKFFHLPITCFIVNITLSIEVHRPRVKSKIWRHEISRNPQEMKPHKTLKIQNFYFMPMITKVMMAMKKLTTMKPTTR